ncbi:MAG: DUF4105 domain-containing protein [Pirellulaceae bacterium]|nr:DUF4105 domain-containing protein [Pirellulaceae bacterium]
MRPLQRKFGKVCYRLLVVFAWLCVLVFFGWAVGALYHLTSVPYALRILLSLAYLAGGVALFFWIPKLANWLSVVAGSIVVVYLATMTQQPRNDRHWVIEQQRMPHIDRNSTHVTIENLRHAVYRSETDFDVHYRDLEFRLGDLQSVWFVVQKFSTLEGLAHTFISFELDSPTGPQYFCVSVEVRREVDEVYSPIRGLYRQFEVMYVVADERDVIGVRTVMRPDDRVHMYRVNATPERVQRLFLDIADRINGLEDQPEFYHTLLKNCTNEIVRHTYKLTLEPINWLDPRIVMPGFSGRFAHSQRLIGAADQSFAELQEQCRIDQVAREVGLEGDFSNRIRESQR